MQGKNLFLLCVCHVFLERVRGEREENGWRDHSFDRDPAVSRVFRRLALLSRSLVDSAN